MGRVANPYLDLSISVAIVILPTVKELHFVYRLHFFQNYLLITQTTFQGGYILNRETVHHVHAPEIPLQHVQLPC